MTLAYLTVRNKVVARVTNNKSLYSHSPFRRRLQRYFMIRDGELKLGGSLIHSLQTFPDGTHGCPLRSSSGLSLVGLTQKDLVSTRDTTPHHFYESDQIQAIMIGANHYSLPRKLTSLLRQRSYVRWTILCDFTLTHVPQQANGLSFSRVRTMLRTLNSERNMRIRMHVHTHIHTHTHTRGNTCWKILS